MPQGRLTRYFLFQVALNTTFGAIIGLAHQVRGSAQPAAVGDTGRRHAFRPVYRRRGGGRTASPSGGRHRSGLVSCLIVLALFAIAETIMGQAVEPLIYGHNTGLSPLAVIVATRSGH